MSSLFCEVLRPNAPIKSTCMIVHGLMGASRNWKTFAASLLQARAGTMVCLPDVRGHGQSPVMQAPHTIRNAASDLGQSIESHSPDQGVGILCGHSLGGKIGLEYVVASKSTTSRVNQLWLLDSNPNPRSLHDNDPVWPVISFLKKIQTPITNRQTLDNMMSEHGFSLPMRQWMGTNLARTPAGFDFRFSLDVVESLYKSFSELDAWPLCEAVASSGTQLHIVRAANSEFWSQEDINKIENLRSRFPGAVCHHVLDGAGHWLHADKPNELLQMMLGHFPSQ